MQADRQITAGAMVHGSESLRRSRRIASRWPDGPAGLRPTAIGGGRETQPLRNGKL
jgi:hypothetical protein